MAASGGQLPATIVAGFRTHTNDWNTTNTGALISTGDAVDMRLDGAPVPKPKYAENTGVYGGVGWQRMGLPASQVEWGGPVTFNARFYSALTRMFAVFFGAETVAAIGSGAYTHAFTMASKPAWVGNFSYNDFLMCHDIAMVKVKGLEFEWNEGQIPKVTVDMFGKRELVDGSGLNTASTMVVSSVTYPTQSTTYPYPLLQGSTIRVHTASGIALAAAHALGVAKINIKLERDYKDYFTNLNLPYRDEPIAGGWFKGSVTFGFPYLKTVAEWDRIVGQTECKIDIAFTGEAIGANTWKWLFEFPCAYAVSEAPKPSNPTPPTFDLTFDVGSALANPSGMSFSVPTFTVTDVITGSHSTNGA